MRVIASVVDQDQRIHCCGSFLLFFFFLSDTYCHYYRNADLSRLGNPCCPGFPTGNARPGQKEVPFCLGSSNRDKKHPFCPGWCYQPGQKVLFCPGCQTRDKRAPLLSRTGVPGWETGTTGVSQSGQINIFVVVIWRVTPAATTSKPATSATAESPELHRL